MIRLLALAVLAQVAGCSAPEPADPPPTVMPEYPGGTPAVRDGDLDAARARWEAAGWADYRFTLRRSCFCPSPDFTGPFEVTVRDGALASVTLDGAAVDDARGLTVDELFALIEEAYERDAETVRLAFDEATGAPTELYIDYSTQMADEEIGYTVSDLEAL